MFTYTFSNVKHQVKTMKSFNEDHSLTCFVLCEYLYLGYVKVCLFYDKQKESRFLLTITLSSQ